MVEAIWDRCLVRLPQNLMDVRFTAMYLVVVILLLFQKFLLGMQAFQ